ncbi:MAG TPA: hypothetical protein VHY37_03520 [Tepidisphaeraceae bacterium]|jgi:hypothetical protein|nr:hypothetical protein [Tepidisphaeraceae bacterium]
MASQSDIQAGGAAVEITADDSKFQKVLKASSATFKTWGGVMGKAADAAAGAVKSAFSAMGKAAEALHKPLDALQKKLESIGNGLKDAGSAMRDSGAKMIGAGAAIGAPLLGTAGAYAKEGSDIARASETTGVKAPALSQLKYAASDAGVEFDALTDSLSKMQRNLYQAGEGSKETADAFSKIGLTVAQLKSMSPEQQFKAIATGLTKLSNETDRTGVTMTIFGRSGQELRPLLDEGGKGINDLMKKADSLGLTMSSETAAAALDFDKTLKDLWEVVGMGAVKIGSTLAPALKQAAISLTGAASAVGDFLTKHSGLVVAAMLGAGAVAGLGVAVVAVGTALSALGTIAGVAAGGIGLVTGAIGLMLSPIGLIVAAIGAAGYALINLGGVGRTVGNYLSGAFGVMKEDAVGAFGGITNALSSGQWGLAAQIAWAFIKVEFQRGKAVVQGLWASTMTALKEGWSLAVEYLSNWDGIKTAAEKAMAWLVNAWHNAIHYVADELQNMFMTTGKKELTAELKRIDSFEQSGRLTHDQADKARQTAHATFDDYDEKQRNDRDSQQASEYAAQQKALDDAFAAKQPGKVAAGEAERKKEEDALKQQLASIDASNTDEVKKLQAKLKALEDSAKGAADATAKTIPPLKDLSKIGDDDATKKFNAKHAAAGTKEASRALVSGMFGGANASLAFGAGSNSHAAATAKNTAITNQKLTELINAIAKSGHAGELTFG